MPMKDGFSLDLKTLQLLQAAAEQLSGSFADLPGVESADDPRIAETLSTVATRMADNYPYFHPLYAGQMLQPPHPVARLAYSLAMYVNPNNHALDGGRASSRMEKEAVAEIASMFGWNQALGHLCGGGTFANLEALWVAGSLHPGKTIVASSQAHYTHGRISGVLGLRFDSVECDPSGRMDVSLLKVRLEKGDVGCVVVTMGTTATGAVDPLPEILKLKEKYGFRVHVDGAYGGYFALADNLAPEAKAAFTQISAADSIVIDPHKHGLQPYGCGCVLFKDSSVWKLYKHDSPYTYFTSSGDMHLGEITLECSRAGASAVALWATQRMLPLTREGEFAAGINACHAAAIELYERLNNDGRFIVPFVPELDIVVWAAKAKSASEASLLSRRIFESAAKRNLHLALVTLPAKFFPDTLGKESEPIVCLRSVLMKTEHKQWVPRIYEILDKVTAQIVHS
ncbi:MAG TPA: aminotransferase class I/II-fold pyridoxal phosphate-dependent enzyme [Terriglobales bacterium]|nr:aminotransferase class I/II-fold pyridoxal phosphate-dependent enzyme [Terriglobales bacterium]